MARKSPGPALYELISARVGERTAPLEEVPVIEEPWPVLSWLSPGRTMRLPVGYLMFAIPAAVCLIIGAYLVGYYYGEQDATELHEREQFTRQDGGTIGFFESSRGLAPVLSSEGMLPRSPYPGRTKQEQLSVYEGPSAVQSESVVGDPRSLGLNYYRLGTFQKDGAIAVAEFCRQQQLEAFAIRHNNSSFYKVIVLPGLEPEQVSTEFDQRLEARIEEVRRKWMTQHPQHRDDLKGYILEKYKG